MLIDCLETRSQIITHCRDTALIKFRTDTPKDSGEPIPTFGRARLSDPVLTARTNCRAVGPHVFMGFSWWSASRVWARSLMEKEAIWNDLLTYQSRVVSSLFQRAIPQPSPMNEEWLTSNAEVFETSAPSWGPSFAMSSVKSVASWLAREMET